MRPSRRGVGLGPRQKTKANLIKIRGVCETIQLIEGKAITQVELRKRLPEMANSIPHLCKCLVGDKTFRILPDPKRLESGRHVIQYQLTDNRTAYDGLTFDKIGRAISSEIVHLTEKNRELNITLGRLTDDLKAAKDLQEEANYALESEKQYQEQINSLQSRLDQVTQSLVEARLKLGTTDDSDIPVVVRQLIQNHTQNKRHKQLK